MTDPLPIEPIAGPLDATVEVPGSKSYTNRALLVAALADGRSSLPGLLAADDTEAMTDGVRRLGATVDGETVVGTPLPDGEHGLDVRMSGTTARFVTAVAATGPGRYTVDGDEQMRARPMDVLTSALRSLGADVDGDSLPLTVGGGVRGGVVELPGDVSSQFLSGLLLAGPLMDEGLELRPTTPLVSESYLRMTVRVMEAFGAVVDGLRVAPGRYRATTFAIEPDASAATYFWAAAAICGGTVRVPGLDRSSLQGDVAFLDLLERMGAGTGELRGIDCDMRDCSDAVPTMAVVAAVANGTTTINGVGFIRRKESDRIGAVVTELRRLGVEAEEMTDGLRITGGSGVRPGVVQTYRDHRMAMAFAVLGLRFPGISIADPGCVDKTFPGFWDALATLRP
jgi:3-phosphoshikimate 1-carboxyvinyltransferase